MKRRVIVGIDPGTTTALAVLDLRGRLLHLSSKKGADDQWIVEHILPYGKPIIFATDRARPPEKVVKLAASFGARLWHPDEDLPVQYKERVAREYTYRKLGPQNDHERDALAAAVAAYAFFAPKFRQVERRLRDVGELEREDEIKEQVVFGQSVERALRPKEEEMGEQRKRGKDERYAHLVARIAELKEALKQREQEIEKLRGRIKELALELQRLKRRDVLAEERAIQRLRREKEDLREALKKAREEVKRLSGLLDEAASKGLLVRKIGENKYELVPPPNSGEERAENVRERLLRMVEEYRKRRAKDVF